MKKYTLMIGLLIFIGAGWMAVLYLGETSGTEDLTEGTTIIIDEPTDYSQTPISEDTPTSKNPLSEDNDPIQLEAKEELPPTDVIIHPDRFVEGDVFQEISNIEAILQELDNYKITLEVSS